MKTFESDLTVAFDVDETIVNWSYPESEIDNTILVTQTMNDGTEYSQRLLPNKFVIDRIKGHFMQGHVVVIWSAGGGSWGQSIIKALGLEEYVSVVLSKPQFFYDDLPAVEFLPEVNRYHLDYKTGARKK